ncbi:MAG TPA: PAS domain-containing protein, partial [Telluria sp.]|nr:PAS domain-containing protein [Telluria sp.]
MPEHWSAALKTAVRLMLTTNYPIFIFAGPRHIQLYNDSYARTLGPERHPSALGMPAQECWPEIWSAIGPEIQAVLDGHGSTWHEDVPFEVRRHGRLEQTWWTYGYSPIEDDDGVHGVLAMCTEITAIHARKAMLRQSYTALAESMDQGFCVLEALDDATGAVRDFRFLECNPAFEQQCGLKAAIGKTVSELLPEVESWWIEHIAQVRRSGAPLRFEVYSAAMQRHFDAYAFPIGLPEQGKAGLLLRDITQRKNDEAALLESRGQALDIARQAEADHQRLTAVLEATPVGLLVADAQGGVLQVNQEFSRIWGQHLPATSSVADYGEWKGWWADHAAHHGQPVAPADWPMARALRSGAKAGGVIEIESFDAPPRRRTVASSAAPVFDREGHLIGGVIALMDITDRVRAEAALRDADRRKDEFLAMLAHELRNPLAPVAAAADLLALDYANADRARQTSAIISRQVKHMTALIDDLLDVSRVTRGLVTLEKTPLDAKRIVSHAVEQVRPLIEARQHALTLHITPEPTYVCGDHKRLVQ